MEQQLNYGDMVTDRATGRRGTFIEYCAPCGTEAGMAPEFAIVEFGGLLGLPETGVCEEVRV
jgi:hypothetical protein